MRNSFCKGAGAMCDQCGHTFAHFLQQNVQNLLFLNFLFKHSKTYKDVLNRIGCYKTELVVLKQDRTF